METLLPHQVDIRYQCFSNKNQRLTTSLLSNNFAAFIMSNNEANNNYNNNNRIRDNYNANEESKKCFIDESKETSDECQRAPKRLRVSQPDVIVKVGDQEYEHYSVLLCAASPYFDTMLSIDMRERLSGRIEFADKDPKDWDALLPFLEPHAPQLTLPTIQQLLPWFHELQMDRLLEESDQFLKKKVQETRDAKSKVRNAYPNYWGILNHSCRLGSHAVLPFYIFFFRVTFMSSYSY